jgi:hypothetical protein
MIKVEANARELFEGNVDSGITFWWEKGSNVILYQTWDHRASGREYHEVKNTWTSADDFVTYFLNNGWNDDYIIVKTSELKLAI